MKYYNLSFLSHNNVQAAVPKRNDQTEWQSDLHLNELQH